MRAKLLSLSLVAWVLAGCQTTQEQVATDDAKCLSYGVSRGSPGYVSCRQQLDANRAHITASERFGNSGGLIGAITRATQQ